MSDVVVCLVSKGRARRRWVSVTTNGQIFWRWHTTYEACNSRSVTVVVHVWIVVILDVLSFRLVALLGCVGGLAVPCRACWWLVQPMAEASVCTVKGFLETIEGGWSDE